MNVLAYTGIRWGEAAALRVRSVDLRRARIRVAASATEVGGVVHTGLPKNHQVRSIPVPSFLRDQLSWQLEGKGLDELVFTAPQGGHLRVANFRRRVFDPAARSIGVPGLVPHELRHTAASLAIASGASVKGVQEMLGHSSATLTLDRYGHLLPDELDGVAHRLDEAVAKARADQVRTEPYSADR